VRRTLHRLALDSANKIQRLPVSLTFFRPAMNKLYKSATQEKMHKDF